MYLLVKYISNTFLLSLEDEEVLLHLINIMFGFDQMSSSSKTTLLRKKVSPSWKSCTILACTVKDT